MKKIFIVLSLLVAASAQASFFQNNCSSADGYVTKADGHVQNYLQVTRYDNGAYSKIELDRSNIDIEELSRTDLESNNQSSCDSGATSGFASWQDIYAIKVKITHVDGTEFSKDILGVSQDRKSISAYLLCDDSGNSQVLCIQ